MLFAELCYRIFEESTLCYHVQDCVDADMENPYEYKSIEYYLFLKNSSIDFVAALLLL